MSNKTALMKLLIFLIIFLLLFCFTSELLKGRTFDGSDDISRKMKGFYNSTDKFDVVFVGSSQAFVNVIPAVLWDNYGITSYDFAVSRQPFWISYHYIKEAVQKDKTKIVALEIASAYYSEEYHMDGVNRLNLNELRWSKNKVDAIKASVPEDMRLSYYLDIIKYHSQWTNLNQYNYKSLTSPQDTNPYKGFYPFRFPREYGEEVNPDFLDTEKSSELSGKNAEYLYKIIDYCKQENIPLILFKAPNSDIWGNYYYNSIEQICSQMEVPFVNFNRIMQGEAHMNVLQAEKFTIELGNYLRNAYDIIDKRDKPDYNQWYESVLYFEQEKNQLALNLETNLSNYLDILIGNPNYISIFSTVDEVFTNIDPVVLDKLAKLGFNTPSIGTYGDVFIGISSSDYLHEDLLSTESTFYNINIDDVNIEMNNKNRKANKLASILINGIEYSQNISGINIVVYDKVLGRVVDTICFRNSNERQAVWEIIDTYNGRYFQLRTGAKAKITIPEDS